MVFDVGTLRHTRPTAGGDSHQGPLRIVGMGGTLRAESRSLWALERALQVAAEAGAETELLSLRELNLPLFRPGRPLTTYPDRVASFIAQVGQADGMLWSTGAYHGTLAGVTKNALDYLEFLAKDDYLEGIPVGLIATSGGEMAAINAIDAMVHVAHALRATVLPLKVPIGRAQRAFDPTGTPTEGKTDHRLSLLGEKVVQESWRRKTAARSPVH